MHPEETLAPERALRKLDISECARCVTTEEMASMKAGRDRLANLQLLNANVNSQKADLPYDKWVIKNFKNEDQRRKYEKECLIPEGVDGSLENYSVFIREREILLEAAVKNCFPDDAEEIILAWFDEDETGLLESPKGLQ